MAVVVTFSLDNYVDVPTRLSMAFAKYPDLRIQETLREVVKMPDESCFIRCQVTVWRDATDPIPSVATACEIYPGRTPYTKMSENEVGFTSALGRALGYMGFGVGKSIASRDEIQAAQSRGPAGKLATVTPISDVDVPFPDEPQRDYASPKQLGMIRALCNGQGCKDANDTKALVGKALDRTISSMSELTKRDASRVIDYLKQSTQEEPF